MDERAIARSILLCQLPTYLRMGSDGSTLDHPPSLWVKAVGSARALLVGLSHEVAAAEKELAASGPARVAVLVARFMVLHVAVALNSCVDWLAADLLNTLEANDREEAAAAI
mmetsp:Transcript_1113/g.2903  ORF Transcript_1113/g.2903 Transcript_1113/m.2903 type:complete len:112 (-) Transcript_1113:18-353(-)